MVVMALQTLVAFILDGERVFDKNMDFHQKPKEKRIFGSRRRTSVRWLSVILWANISLATKTNLGLALDRFC